MLKLENIKLLITRNDLIMEKQACRVELPLHIFPNDVEVIFHISKQK